MLLTLGKPFFITADISFCPDLSECIALFNCICLLDFIDFFDCIVWAKQEWCCNCWWSALGLFLFTLNNPVCGKHMLTLRNQFHYIFWKRTYSLFLITYSLLACCSYLNMLWPAFGSQMSSKFSCHLSHLIVPVLLKLF